MSNLVYPVLPGLEFPVRRILLPPPVFKLATPSRRTFRGRSATINFYRYQLSYAFLSVAAALAEWQTLEGFFKKVGGDFDSFLFSDPDDGTVTAMQFGTGDGTTTQFQLVRSLGGFAEPIYDLNGAPSIYKAAVLQSTPSQYSISATGLVTFVTAPAAAAVLTWTGSYYRRCVFTRGELDLEKFMAQFFSAGQVEFETFLP